MKRTLIIGIIAYIIGLIMIMTGLYVATNLINKFAMLGASILLVFGGISNAAGYILIKIYLEDND